MIVYGDVYNKILLYDGCLTTNPLPYVNRLLQLIFLGYVLLGFPLAVSFLVLDLALAMPFLALTVRFLALAVPLVLALAEPLVLALALPVLALV